MEGRMANEKYMREEYMTAEQIYAIKREQIECQEVII